MSHAGNPSSDREIRLVRRLLAVLAAVIMAVILWKRPFWGLMDDHLNAVEMVPTMWRQGVLRTSYLYAMEDLKWGMFRPTYPLMVFLLYGPSVATAPWVLYVLNAGAAMAIFYFVARTLEAITGTNRWLTLLASASVFHAYDIFQHPSLQEKLILLFGAGVLWLQVAGPKRKGLRWALLAGVFALGVMAKASICIYFSMAVWVAFWRGEGLSLSARVRRALPFAVGCFAALVFFALVSRRGSYTAGLYSLSKVVPNLLSLDGILFALTVLASFAVLLSDWLRGRTPQPLAVTPAVGLAAFLVIFLPWGIAAYVQTMIAPLLGATWIWLASRAFGRRREWVLGFAVVATGFCGYRSYANFSRLSDIGAIVRAAPGFAAAGINEIYMPCAEGSGAMERYFAGVAHVQIPVKHFGDLAVRERSGKYVLFDRALCPLPGRAAMVENCQSDTVFQGSFSGSFRLVKLRCDLPL